MAGFSQGGGVGLALASWMTEGDPGFDVWAMDVARFGPFARSGYTNAKVRENYSRRFRITFPNEELPAARPLRTTPIHDLLLAENAVMGASYGLEHALWFAPKGTEPTETVTFGRSNAHAHVAEECARVRERAGLLEISNFAKYMVEGPEAEHYLARILAGRIPGEGRISLCPMLNDKGRLIGDFTLARLAAERFMITGSGIAESCHLRWFEQHLPKAGVTLRAVTNELLGMAIAGPASTTILAALTDEDLSSGAFPFLAIKEIELDLVPARVGRISYTGDLGYEIWTEAPYLRRLYLSLREAGEAHGLGLFGARALNSLRLEKSFGSWTREYRPLYAPWKPASAASSTTRAAASSAMPPPWPRRRKAPPAASSRWSSTMPASTSWATSRSGRAARSFAGSPRAAGHTGAGPRSPWATCRRRTPRRTTSRSRSWATAARPGSHPTPFSTPKAGACAAEKGEGKDVGEMISPTPPRDSQGGAGEGGRASSRGTVPK
jgi:glycine cleavage system aminomethyltransferase T